MLVKDLENQLKKVCKHISVEIENRGYDFNFKKYLYDRGVNDIDELEVTSVFIVDSIDAIVKCK